VQGARTSKDLTKLIPTIGRSAVIGTCIGALPGVGSTLAATLGYTSAKRRHEKRKDADAPAFGDGAPEGIAATEAANSSVSGANLIPVLFMARIPKARLLPIVLLLTLTAIYVQETSMVAVWITLFFGFLGYVMRRIGMSPLPFVIAFILGGNLEATARQAFAATGADPFFLFNSPIALAFMVFAIGVVAFSLRKPAT